MLRLREAKLGDVDALSDLESKIFLYDVISPRQILYLVKSDTATVVLAEINNRIIGYMILLRRKKSKVLRIYSIGVVETIRKLGIGLEFLRYAEQRSQDFGCNRLQIEVHMKNKNGLIFFLSSGFFLYGRKDHYYTDGAMALLLKKELEDGTQQ